VRVVETNPRRPLRHADAPLFLFHLLEFSKKRKVQILMSKS